MSAGVRAVLTLIAAVVACGAVVAGATVLAAPLVVALADWSPAWREALFSFILYGALALVAVVGRRLAGRNASRQRSALLPWLAVGLAIGIGGFLLTLADAALAGTTVRGQADGAVGTLLFGSLVVWGQSASEELFFRGWLQPELERAWGPLAAIGITALAFSGLHVAGGARTPLELVNLMLGGILFGLLAWRSGGLAAPIMAHAGWNWAETILFGLAPNPGVGGFGAVHELELIGAARWGGSASGLNASVAMTIVLVALIVPFSPWSARGSRRSGPVPS